MSEAPILPQEIVADILSRLPVKSLCRFKCVSQSWYALISDPHFAKTHLTRNNNNNNNNLLERLILVADSDYFSLYSVDYSTDVPVAKKLDFQAVEVESYNVWSEILGSCNGLVLALNEANDAKYLLNPSTRESKKLPKSPFALDSIRPYHLYGLGYDSSTDDYKVVMLSYYARATSDDDTNTVVSVYALKANSWRSIRGSSYVHTAGDSCGGVYVNGCLHWLACRGSDYLSVIVAFDLANENFREVLPPDSVDDDGLLQYSPAVLGGCLCLFDSPSSTQTDVWMMKEYGARESWTKFTICPPNMYSMELVCLLEDGEFLLAMDEEKLVVYNQKEGTKRDMVVCGIPTVFTAGGTYVESLVSPDCGNGIVRRCEAPHKRLKRSYRLYWILRGMFKAHKARTEHASINKESYRLKRSLSSGNIEASTSSSIDDHFSISRCLDLLKSNQIVEGPVYEKALRIFQNPHRRKAFITMLYDKKMF